VNLERNISVFELESILIIISCGFIGIKKMGIDYWLYVLFENRD